jgi:hypothetical protein
MILTYRCKDDPEANGRKPVIGEQRYTLTFPLENGDELQVYAGKETMNNFESFIAEMMVDDATDAERERK